MTWNSSPDQLLLVHQTQFVLDSDLEGLRHQEFDRILASMRSVAQLMGDMSLMTTRQGELLDRIDYNLEHASERTKAAVQIIAERSDQDQLDRRKLVILLLVVMIIVMLTAVILKPKK